MVFIANPFMGLDVDNISKQMAELFDVSALEMEMEMEVINLQNNIQLKSQQHSPNFWCLVDPGVYKNIHQAALKAYALFGSTYLCEAAFSDMNVIKCKFRTRLSDDLNDCNDASLVEAMQCQSAH